MANQIKTESELNLRINSQLKTVVYLSASWQPDDTKDFGNKVITKLDSNDVLVIGDVQGYMDMPPNRITRIMEQVDCFVTIFPFRPKTDKKTSDFMLSELDIALSLKLPIYILYDSRIPIVTNKNAINTILLLGSSSFSIDNYSLLSIVSFDIRDSDSEDIELIHLMKGISTLSNARKKKVPYSFFISRLQDDFKLPRLACIAAAEEASGIPCIWINSQDYKTDLTDTTKRVKLLIENAEFVVAELSLTDENQEIDNPSRAHEIGLATAYNKKLFITSHNPTRPLYHGLVAHQLIWWDNESELFSKLYNAIDNEKDAFGRNVYNYYLANSSNQKIRKTPFDKNAYPAWTPPTNENANGPQSWLYALSIGITLGCFSYLLGRFAKYDQTLDLVSIFVTIIAFFFTSRINKRIQRALMKSIILKWTVPIFAFIIFLFTIYIKIIATTSS